MMRSLALSVAIVSSLAIPAFAQTLRDSVATDETELPQPGDALVTLRWMPARGNSYQCLLRVVQPNGRIDEEECGQVPRQYEERGDDRPSALFTSVSPRQRPTRLYEWERYHAGLLYGVRVETRGGQVMVVHYGSDEGVDFPARTTARLRLRPAQPEDVGHPLARPGDREVSEGLLAFAEETLGARTGVLSWAVARAGEKYVSAIVLEVSTLALWRSEERRRGTLAEANRRAEEATERCRREYDRREEENRRAESRLREVERAGQGRVAEARREMEAAERTLRQARQGGTSGGRGGYAARGGRGTTVSRAEQALARAREALLRAEADVRAALDEAEMEAGDQPRIPGLCDGGSIVARIDPESRTAVVCVERGEPGTSPTRRCQRLERILAANEGERTSSQSEYEDEDSEPAVEDTILLDEAPRGLFDLRGDTWRDDFDGDGDEELAIIIASARPAIDWLDDRTGAHFVQWWEHHLLIVEPARNTGFHPLLLETHADRLHNMFGDGDFEPLRRTVRFLRGQGGYVLGAHDLDLISIDGHCEVEIDGAWVARTRSQPEWSYATGVAPTRSRGAARAGVQGECDGSFEQRRGEIRYDVQARQWNWVWPRQ